MNRTYFLADEEKVFNRVTVLKELIAQQDLYSTPSPLLISQLTKLTVLSATLQEELLELTKILNRLKGEN